MKLKFSRPSPAMCVASIALFVSLGGTSVAAVSYARNAGAVDGKSAVASSASQSSGAGRLIATASKGPDKGKIPGKWLADVPRTQAFGKSFDVADNATGAQEPFVAVSGVGTLSSNCADQNARAAFEDPISNIQFANTSGETLNLTRTKGTDEVVVVPLANGTVSSTSIGGSSSFAFQIQKGTTNVLIQGGIRQDGRNTADAKCLIYGTAITVDQ